MTLTIKSLLASIWEAEKEFWEAEEERVRLCNKQTIIQNTLQSLRLQLRQLQRQK